MEVHKFPTKLVLSILPLVIIIGLCAIFAPHILFYQFYVHWLALACLIFMCVMPFGRVRLSADEQTSRLPVWQWLGFIILIEAALLVFFLGVYAITNQSLPVLTGITKMEAHKVIYASFYQWGFYPWAFYAVMAALLGYWSYHKQQPGTIATLLKPVFPYKETSKLGDFLVGLMRIPINFSYTFMLCFSILAVLLLLRSQIKLPIATHMNSHMMAISIIVLLVIISKRWREKLRTMCVKRVSPLIIAGIFVALISILIAFSNMFLVIINKLFPAFSGPNGMGEFFNKHSAEIWQLFAAALPLAFIPTIAATIAYISRGYRIRSVLIAVMLLPIILAIAAYQPLQQVMIWLPNTVLACIFTLIGSVILLTITFQQRWLTPIMRASQPAISKEKYRATDFFMQSLLQLAAFLVIFYFAAGVYAITVFYMALMLVPLLIFSIVSVASLRTILSSGVPA